MSLVHAYESMTVSFKYSDREFFYLLEEKADPPSITFKVLKLWLLHLAGL